MKLQQLIDRLEQCKQDAYVNWDFGHAKITKALSWRGIYAELALGWSDDEGFANVGELVAHLKSCIGKQFTGYKGGEYVMTPFTEVHCDNYGRCSETNITGVIDNENFVYLETRSNP